MAKSTTKKVAKPTQPDNSGTKVNDGAKELNKKPQKPQ